MSAGARVLYLAHGSNMAPARIEDRLGPCPLVGAARLERFSLRFHKRGRDGSGKCDAFFTGATEDRLFGVLFELSAAQCARLDRFEGPGYERRTVTVEVGGARAEAYAYVARPDTIDEALVPYEWYHAFVLHGATVGRLPADYVQALRAVRTMPDPDRARHEANRLILGA